jgi:hypothetical protein
MNKLSEETYLFGSSFTFCTFKNIQDILLLLCKASTEESSVLVLFRGIFSVISRCEFFFGFICTLLVGSILNSHGWFSLPFKGSTSIRLHELHWGGLVSFRIFR